MIIGQVTQRTVNVTSEAEVLRATFSGTEPQVAIARIDMANGTIDAPYYVRIYINGTLITPDAPITPTVSAAVLQSRNFIVNPGDLISLRLLGAPDDTAVVVDAFMITATFNHAELADAISKLSVQPIQYVLAPQPQPVHPLYAERTCQR